jgi:hypothetical protein
MERKPVLFCLIMLSCMLGWNAQATSPPHSNQLATWRPYDLIVDLQNLPQPYSCDALWYKFHDVLLALGARPDLKILTYKCQGDASGVGTRSPSAQLQFSLPELLPPAQAGLAQFQASTTTVHLTPGHPASLHASDCELLRQMKDGLIASLSRQVISVDLACDAPPAAQKPFSLTLQTLTPSLTESKVLAHAGSSPRR